MQKYFEFEVLTRGTQLIKFIDWLHHLLDYVTYALVRTKLQAFSDASKIKQFFLILNLFFKGKY